jgi:hypothetical protein
MAEPMRSGLTGLTTKSKGPGAHRHNNGLDAALPCLHDHGDLDPLLAKGIEEGDTVHLGHHQVEDDYADLVAVAGKRLQPLPAVLGKMGSVSNPFDRMLEKSSLHRIVVDQKNMRVHRLSPCCSWVLKPISHRGLKIPF